MNCNSTSNTRRDDRAILSPGTPVMPVVGAFYRRRVLSTTQQKTPAIRRRSSPMPGFGPIAAALILGVNNYYDVTSIVVLVIVIALVIAAVVGFSLFHQRRSRRLRSRFGPEYDRAVREHGSAARAEDALLAREKRTQRMNLRPLSAPERDRFVQNWHDIQARFVDDPSGCIRDADRLVYEVMTARGYPMSDFEHRAEDISVDHPHVVQNYRSAHEIALSNQEGSATTEDLRKGLVYYRELFDNLVETPVAGMEVRR